MLFLATREDTLLRAAALVTLWGRGFVEPIVPPPHPRHIAAQQLLALALQEGQVGTRTWREWWGDLKVMEDGQAIFDHLVEHGFLDTDSGMAFIGPQAERHFGRRHFMELLSAFTTDPEMTVLLGREEVGSVSPLSIATHLAPDEARVLVLAGKTWKVTSIDWRRRTIQVVEHAGAGRTRWAGGAPETSYELTRAVRDVLLGEDPPAEMSRRASGALMRIRDERADQVASVGLILQRSGENQTWWTFGGTRINATLATALSEAGFEASANAESVIMPVTDVADMRGIRAAIMEGNIQANFDEQALDGLKFSVALPMNLAIQTLAERGTDDVGACAVLDERVIVEQL